MKYEKYLPLGSVVLLKNGKKRLMVSGFTAMADNKENKVYDYVGVLYPEGFLAPNKVMLFNHQDIEKIYCIGYSDDEEKGFKEVLKEMENEIRKEIDKKFKKE